MELAQHVWQVCGVSGSIYLSCCVTFVSMTTTSIVECFASHMCRNESPCLPSVVLLAPSVCSAHKKRRCLPAFSKAERALSRRRPTVAATVSVPVLSCCVNAVFDSFLCCFLAESLRPAVSLLFCHCDCGDSPAACAASITCHRQRLFLHRDWKELREWPRCRIPMVIGDRRDDTAQHVAIVSWGGTIYVGMWFR